MMGIYTSVSIHYALIKLCSFVAFAAEFVEVHPIRKKTVHVEIDEQKSDSICLTRLIALLQ